MKKLIAALALFYVLDGYGYPHQVIDVYNPDPVCCCSPPSIFSGFYIDAVIGYTWFSFYLTRPPSTGLSFPLNNGDITENGITAGGAVGYDLYPRARVPLRLEYSLLYDNQSFSLDPVFSPVLDPTITAKDGFTIYNHMVTAYMDWHNCTRFIPFVGASLGWIEINTSHLPLNAGIVPETTFRDTMHNTSWGGTIGTRFMFNTHLIANLQLRYNNRGSIIFANTAFLTIDPNSPPIDYLSEFTHETTLWLGLGYQF